MRLPALAEADEQLRADTVLGPEHFTRRRGEALHPGREPPAVLEHIRRTIGEYNFAGQYQQAPAPLGGGLVKAVPALSARRIAAALRAHRAELGHRQQGQRTQRL